MPSKILPTVIFLTLAAPAQAYVLRTDSTGATVQWKAAVTFVLDDGAAKAMGPGALDAITASAAELGLAADIGVTVSQGQTHGVGYSEGNQPNENAIVVLTDWPFSPSAIASTVVTVDAQSHAIIDTDVAFNGSSHHFGVIGLTTGETDGDDDRMTDDVQNTATHELGHALGLQHNPNDAAVVMYPSARPREISKRTLQPDDKAGLVALYPPGSVTTGHPNGCSSAPGPAALGLLALGLLMLRRRPVPAPVAVRSRPHPARRATFSLREKGALVVFALAATAARASAPAPVERVAEGRVVQVRTVEPKAGERLLFSEVTLQLTKCHTLDKACGTTLKIRVPGGRFGRLEQTVTDQPLPVEGEQLAVALSHQVERVFHLEKPNERVELSLLLARRQFQTVPISEGGRHE